MSDPSQPSEDPETIQLNATQGASATGRDNEVLLSFALLEGGKPGRLEIPMPARVARGLARQILDAADATDAANNPSAPATPNHGDKPYPPISLMDAYYVGVGRISAALAHLELRISLTIWELANVEQYIGACITAQFIAPAPRLQALAALVSQRGLPRKP